MPHPCEVPRVFSDTMRVTGDVAINLYLTRASVFFLKEIATRRMFCRFCAVHCISGLLKTAVKKARGRKKVNKMRVGFTNGWSEV